MSRARERFEAINKVIKDAERPCEICNKTAIVMQNSERDERLICFKCHLEEDANGPFWQLLKKNNSK